MMWTVSIGQHGIIICGQREIHGHLTYRAYSCLGDYARHHGEDRQKYAELEDKLAAQHEGYGRISRRFFLPQVILKAVEKWAVAERSERHSYMLL
mgnify:FL=1